MERRTRRQRQTKWKRTTRACNLCRARKHRCDGQKPSCSTCSALSRPCSYESGLKKRGLPTGYVRSLELLWGLVFTLAPNSLRVVNELIERIEFVLDSRAKLILVSKLVEDPETLRQAWEDSALQTKLDNLLSSVQDAINADKVPKEPEVEGNATDELLTLIERSFEGIQNDLSNGSQLEADVASQPEVINNILTPPCEQVPQTNTQKQRDILPISFPPNSRKLIDSYFAHTHCWLPIVQKHKMFEILHLNSHSQSKSPHVDEGSLATLWAILAYSSLHESKDENGPWAPSQMYLKARQLIPNENAWMGDYAQAMLILSIFKLRQGEPPMAWTLIGQAVRMSLDVCGPPYRYGSTGSTAYSNDRNAQSILILSCFVLDTIISGHLGRPPHLRTMDIRAIPMPGETGLDEWEPQAVCLGESTQDTARNLLLGHQPQRAISIFNCLVKIICILNDAISYPIMRTANGIHAKYSLALRRLYHELPAHCELGVIPGQNQLEDAQGLSPQLINLHLAFKSTEMLLESKKPLLLPGRPVSSTLGTTTEIPSIISLISMFKNTFGISNMPATFMSYNAIGERTAMIRGVSGFSSVRTQLNDLTSFRSPASTAGFSVGYLPTPVEYTDNVVAGGSETATCTDLRLANGSQDDLSNDRERFPSSKPATHNDEARSELFDNIDVSNIDFSLCKDLGDLAHLNGMEW